MIKVLLALRVGSREEIEKEVEPVRELKTFTAIDYQGNKLGTCKASDIHEARGKLQRFKYGLIKFTDNNVNRIVTL